MTRVESAESLDSGMRWGFICIALFLAIAFAYFANTARFPALDALSKHEITPVNFGMMQLTFKNKQNRDTGVPPKDLGYFFGVPSQSLPTRYDKSSVPELTEISGGGDPNTKNLLFHDALNITQTDATQLADLVGKPITTWFYEGKIIAILAANQFVISHERASAGMRKKVQWQWLISLVSFVLAIGLLVYPKFKSTHPHS